MRDAVAVDDSIQLIQNYFRKWYRVRLFAPSRYLPHAAGLGFVTGPGGTLDRTGAIVIRRQKYPIGSVIASEGPKRQRR